MAIIKRIFQNICVQQFRTISNEVRVRFAPSPTGYLHLGGLRTALYNYLFAKSNNGKFILRIEDTDQSRLIPGAVEQLQNDLNWVGIQIDEGPNNSGCHGPYVQSQRLNIYKEHVKLLLETEMAYYCFCTDKRLGLLKKEAFKMRQIPKYDNRCRHLSKDEIQMRINRGEKHCVRFKLKPDCETFEDMIYGNIAYDVALNEGDPVIMKNDGFPTYHFANVVDDHLMKISHVLRGVEWQISTTKHILMYRAFNWNPPIYGHLPLLMNADGTKLSKRQGDIQIARYREEGIFPQALINFVVSYGGGFKKQQKIKPKSYSMDELINQFDIDRVNEHSTKVMSEMLNEFNKLEIINQIENETNCNKLIAEVKELLIKKFPITVNQGTLNLDEEYIRTILYWSKTRINKLSDLISNDLLFLWIIPHFEKPLTEEQLQIIKSLCEILDKESLDFKKDDVKKLLKTFADNNNISFSKLMKIMRGILSGLKEGPGVAEMIEILGKENTILRISNCLRKHNIQV